MRAHLMTLGTCALLATAAHAAPVAYEIDPTHTFATFEIDHFGASTNRVRFDKAEGTVNFDKAGKTGKVEIVLDMNSLNSGTPAFDAHLKSADIFDTAKFPKAQFVSEKFVYNGEKLQSVQGQLTLMGQTHPVTIAANKFTCYDSPMLKKEVCGGDFEATIDRSQWGLNYAVDFGVPKQVRLVLQIEAAKK